MNDAFYDFDWTVATRYEWRDWLDDKGKSVTVPAEGVASLESATAIETAWERSQKPGHENGPLLLPTIDPSVGSRHYHPMHREHATLYRTFGALDYRDPAAVLDFAQKYGALGVPTWKQNVRVRGGDGELRRHHAYGEPFVRWALEIAYMREGLQLERKRSLEALKRLKWLFDRHLQHVQGRLGFTPAGDPKLEFEPLSLIAAMWLQLAMAVTGDKRFLACKFCRKMFEISTELTGFRSHRVFCSESCKTLDYRKRKRTALRLAAGGARLAEIAEKSDTEIATVRAWVGLAKRGRAPRRPSAGDPEAGPTKQRGR